MGTVTAIKTERDVEDRAMEGLCALIEREVDTRVRPLEDALEQIKSQPQSSTGVKEYLDIAALSARIHTPADTIRDWVYKKNKNKIPVIKIPTGGLMFEWNEFESWMRSLDS